MKRVVRTIAGILGVITLGLVAALPAQAATPADKPVVYTGSLKVVDGGGASPDTWRTYVTVPVYGYNFTPGGNVYVTFQDLTAGTPAVSGEWTRAGNGFCGLECSNYGRISYSRTLSYPYRSVCNHWLRVWAWDQSKSPQAGYGWSYTDTLVRCS